MRCIAHVDRLFISACRFRGSPTRTKISFRLYLLPDDGYGFVNSHGTSTGWPSYNFKDLKADLSQQVVAFVERGKQNAPVDTDTPGWNTLLGIFRDPSARFSPIVIIRSFPLWYIMQGIPIDFRSRSFEMGAIKIWY